jgi:hypothetical protein
VILRWYCIVNPTIYRTLASPVGMGPTEDHSTISHWDKAGTPAGNLNTFTANPQFSLIFPGVDCGNPAHLRGLSVAGLAGGLSIAVMSSVFVASVIVGRKPGPRRGDVCYTEWGHQLFLNRKAVLRTRWLFTQWIEHLKWSSRLWRGSLSRHNGSKGIQKVL